MIPAPDLSCERFISVIKPIYVSTGLIIGERWDDSMRQKSVLLICRDNALLSPFAEAYINNQPEEAVRAFSAGLQPGETVSPRLKRMLHKAGLSAEGLQPKSWQIFAQPFAPEVDMIVCLDRLTDSAPADLTPTDLEPVDLAMQAAFPNRPIRQVTGGPRPCRQAHYRQGKREDVFSYLVEMAQMIMRNSGTGHDSRPPDYR